MHQPDQKALPILVGVLFTGALVAWAALVGMRRQASAAVTEDPTSNPLGNPPGMVDRLVMLDTADAFAAGARTGVDLLPSTPARLALSPSVRKGFPREGDWESPQLHADFPFTELVPSWNISTPPDTGVRLEVRVRDAANGSWSPYLHLGYWGRPQQARPRVLSFPAGTVNIDNLTLTRAADAFQVRIRFASFALDHAVSPAVRRVAVCYSGVVRDAETRARLAPPPGIDGNWAVSLPVPFRPQGDGPEIMRNSICSPSSTTMVAAYCGVDRPIVENALAIYDNENDIFGNWGRAVARAGELGLDAWLDRFRTWDQVKAQIARGNPVIASIVFEKGEFPSALYAQTAGHLIVIRGFTASGDVVVNDPASRAKGHGVVYKADELGRAWFGHGGVGYVIRRPPVAATASAPATLPAH